jgi:hypothetical protein
MVKNIKIPQLEDIIEEREKQIKFIFNDSILRLGSSLNSVTGNIFNAKDSEQCKSFFKEIVVYNPNFDPSKPIYIIGITNHHGASLYDDEICWAFALARQHTNTPLFGIWVDTDQNDREYLDITCPKQFDDGNTKDIEMGRVWNQKYILKITQHGEANFIKITPVEK